MRCADTREILVAWLDGELSPEEADRVESHLGSCPACMRERAALETSGALLARLDPPGMPESGLAARVMKAVKSGVDPWCLHVRRELVAFADGELPATEARPVEEHLAECDACDRERCALVRTGAALGAWELPPLDADIAGTLPVAKRRKRRRALLRLVPMAAAAAVLATAAFVGYGLYAPSGSSPKQALQYPDAEVLQHLELLKAQARLNREIDRDPRIVELENRLRWIDGYSDEEIALLTSQER